MRSTALAVLLLILLAALGSVPGALRPPPAVAAESAGFGKPAVEPETGAAAEEATEAATEETTDGEAEDGAPAEEPDGEPAAAAAELAPGAWEPCLELGDEIFPAWILATTDMKSDEPNAPDQIGDPYGAVGIRVASPADDCPITVTVSSAKILRPVTFRGVLPKKGETYFVNPDLDFDYDTLASVRQPFPENVKLAVSLAGGPVEEKIAKVNVRAVNDCPYSFTDEDGKTREVAWTYAAYVNENHPAIHEIMAKATDGEGKPMAFSSYQGDRGEVLAEIRSIWNVLKARGIRYSSITTTSLAVKDVGAQYMRRFGESLAATQANCADGTVLLASILRRMELETFLISVPGHMFLAVKLEPGQGEATTLDELTGIETTMLADSTLEEAVEEGNDELRKNAKGLKKALASDDMANGDYQVVDLEAARQMGVLPIREPDAK